jgi:hypothetical protein
MDSSKRPVGRPKSPHRTGPLVLEDARGGEKVEVELSAATARELAEYAAWVELSSSLATADATFTTVEYALREVFRRDRVWQERRRAGERSVSSLPTVKADAPTLPRPASLLPPASAGATRVGPDRPLP